jgi:hypothetical protein
VSESAAQRRVRRYRAQYRKASKRGTATPVIAQAALLHEACGRALAALDTATDAGTTGLLLRALAALEAKLLALYPTMGLLRDSVQRRNASRAGDDAEAGRQFRARFGGAAADEEAE